MRQLTTSDKGKDSSLMKERKWRADRNVKDAALYRLHEYRKTTVPWVHLRKQAVSVYEWDYWLPYWCSSPEPSSSSCWKQICHAETLIELTSRSLSVPLIKRKIFCSWSSFGLWCFPALRCASFGHGGGDRRGVHVGATMSSGHPKTTQALLKLSFHFVVKYACLDFSLDMSTQ